MKSIPFTHLIGILLPLTAHAAAPQMRDAATSAQLGLTYRKAELANPMKMLKPAEVPELPTAVADHSILDESDTLCFNGNATLVPKRAVLLIPKSVENRLKYVNGARLLSWSAFYAINRGWITTMEVSRNQAEGNEPIPEDTQKLMQKSGNLIVATYQGGPISVLPPKTPEESATKPVKP